MSMRTPWSPEIDDLFPPEPQYKAKVEAPLDPEPDLDDNDAQDVLRDTKWVYKNMASLIRTDKKSGVKTLDPKVLKKAPSGGAVSLATYALEDPKAFFEKFVVKILPKEAEASKGPTEEEIQQELDPNFAELSKYLTKLGSRRNE